MKKQAAALLLCLLLAVTMIIPATAEADVRYTDEALGFSVSIPAEMSGTVELRENPNGVSLYYLPAASNGWDGLLGSVVVVSPKSEYFSTEYYDTERTIIAVGSDSIYYFIPPVGGADSGKETMEGYRAALAAVGAEYLRENIIVDGQEDIPTIDAQLLSTLVGSWFAKGEEPLTRSVAASELCAVLAVDADGHGTMPFSDMSEGSAGYEAVLYLSDLGVINGYTDGSFRPSEAMTRAEFCTLLSRLLFVPHPWWYGEPLSVSDANDEHWAWDYLNYASGHGWLKVQDGAIHPDETITCADAATALRAVSVMVG